MNRKKRPGGDREAVLRHRILERFDGLSPRQRRAAEYFLEHVHELPFLEVPGLARGAGVSQATVVRLCQSLGYDGFSGLKDDLLEGVRSRVVRSPNWREVPESLAAGPEPDAVAEVARQEIEHVERSAAMLDRPAFDRAVAALRRARAIHVFGLGISAHLASLFAYLLTQLGRRATPLATSFSSAIEPLVPLGAEDLVVAISFPPYSRATIALVREAAKRGIPTLVLSDRATSPAARSASVALAVRSGGMMFTNSFAAVSVILNALALGLARSDRAATRTAVRRISQILSGDPSVSGGKG
jgi:DNA-binding MurR/RpiR family transcriptional regulator